MAQNNNQSKIYEVAPLRQNATYPPGGSKSAVYMQFVLWSAMPPIERTRLGIETQDQFCETYKVHRATTARWKQRVDFQDRVDKILKAWAFDQKPTVAQSIYKAVIKGNSDAMRIWLKYFEGWDENPSAKNAQNNGKPVKVELGEQDVRFIVDGLPEPYRTKFNGYINDIITTTYALRNAREISDTAWEERPEGYLEPEADYDAQDVPVEVRHEVASGYKKSVRCDVVGETHAHNYQSAERWW